MEGQIDRTRVGFDSEFGGYTYEGNPTSAVANPPTSRSRDFEPLGIVLRRPEAAGGVS